ncbi:porin [Paraburkholderia sp. GAS334]|uniref:porin n=1 Tax=Paraburkholderia sp. GAS334 TaxID=3035131 RepID=UPI003D24370F
MGVISRGIGGAALLLAAGSAMAQSKVTLYGVVDTFVQYLNNGGAGSVSARSGGSTGSLVGFKGSEDLGRGVKAVFDLESGFNVNNGGFFVDSSKLFGRQSWVGLASDDYGRLTFGRQYQPTFWIAYFAEPFRGDEALSPFAAMIVAMDRRTIATQYAAGRSDNSIVYQSPDVGGFKLYSMYAFADALKQPVPASVGPVFDVGVTYTGYGLYAGLAYQNQHAGRETLPGLPADLDQLATEHFTGALAYQLGIANFQFIYTYARPKDAPAGSRAAQADAAHPVSTIEVGATIQATAADTVEVAAVERNVRGAHDNTTGIQLGVDHSLSKRTSLYARAGYMKNHGGATTSWPGIAVTGTGTSQTLMAVGLTHRF